MSRCKREDSPYGPGNTFWYIDDDGEIIRCRWNDAAWCTRTFVNIGEGKKVREWEILKLLNEAYQMGMDDRQILIKRALGV